MIILIDYAGRGLCSLVTETMYIALLSGPDPFIPAMLSCLLTLISTDCWFKDEETFKKMLSLFYLTFLAFGSESLV